jgi:hypothetical protein
MICERCHHESVRCSTVELQLHVAAEARAGERIGNLATPMLLGLARHATDATTQACGAHRSPRHLPSLLRITLCFLCMPYRRLPAARVSQW